MQILGIVALLLLLALVALVWRSSAGADQDDSVMRVTATTPQVAERIATVPATLTASPLPATAVTITPAPPASPTPRATVTSTPSPIPSATPLPTDTPFPSATPPDRSCPDPAPPRPEYTRYSLGPAVWPAPDPGGFAPHFWLGAPLVPSEDETIRFNFGFPYGYDANGRYLLHNGVDISGSLGTPLLAVADGTVLLARDDFDERYGWRCNWYGHLLVLELEQRYQGLPVYVLYGHVLNFLVEEGEQVRAGQPLVEVGVGGAATAPHLHLEVRVGGNQFGMTRNPFLWLAPAPDRGVIAGRLLDPEGKPWQGVLVTAAGPIYTSSWSYLGDERALAQPDDQLAENLVIPDLPAGRYRVFALVQGEEYSQYVDVAAGEVSVVELVTQPYKTPTPTPPVTPTPEGTAQGDPQATTDAGTVITSTTTPEPPPASATPTP